MNSHFSILPHEVTQAIFSLASHKELMALQRTCYLFYLQIHQNKELKKIILESWIDAPMLPCYTVQYNANFLFRYGKRDAHVREGQYLTRGACKPCDRKELLRLVRITLKELIRINYGLPEVMWHRRKIYVWSKENDLCHPVDYAARKIRRNWIYKNDFMIQELCRIIISYKNHYLPADLYNSDNRIIRPGMGFTYRLPLYSPLPRYFGPGNFQVEMFVDDQGAPFEPESFTFEMLEGLIL